MKIIKRILIVVVVVCSTMMTLKAQKKSNKWYQLGTDEKSDLQFMKETMGATQTRSGLLYHELVKGTGEKLPKFSKVKIKYNLGTVEQKVKNIVPFKEYIKEVDSLPYGIQEALKIMPVGSEWFIVMPVKLCSNKYEEIGGGKVLMTRLTLLSTIE